MTSKRIEYDPHAVRRMRQRGFTRADVRAILARGTREFIGQPPGSQPIFGRRLVLQRRRGRRPGKRRAWREARVIYLENAARIYVITVEWLGDRPGLYD